MKIPIQMYSLLLRIYAEYFSYAFFSEMLLQLSEQMIWKQLNKNEKISFLHGNHPKPNRIHFGN